MDSIYRFRTPCGIVDIWEWTVQVHMIIITVTILEILVGFSCFGIGRWERIVHIENIVFGKVINYSSQDKYIYIMITTITIQSNTIDLADCESVS